MKRLSVIGTAWLSASLLAGCASPKLAGQFDGQTYISPQGDYAVLFPPAEGRMLRDDERGVTFVDLAGSRVRFFSLAFEPGSEIDLALQSRGRQAALELAAERLYGTNLVSRFHAERAGGTCSLLFSKLPSLTRSSAALFIQGRRVYIAETCESKEESKDRREADETLLREQDERLVNRALRLAKSIQVR